LLTLNKRLADFQCNIVLASMVKTRGSRTIDSAPKPVRKKHRSWKTKRCNR